MKTRMARFAGALAVLLLLSTAGPAHAILLEPGESQTYNFEVPGRPGFTATVEITLVSITTSQIVFDIDVTNTSSDSSGVITSFGFEINSGAVVTGGSISDIGGATDVDVFTTLTANDDLTGNFPDMDFCAFPNQCVGGNVNNGLDPGQTDLFRITADGTFNGEFTDIVLTAMKFQTDPDSFEIPGTPGDGGGGSAEVPVPATLILLGAGLVGMAALSRLGR
ncbi:MAG TPA: cistern family PEP-CTERM protein [Candidatus Tectomicrobia bacterium]|nr:cistern family PEP-CTERM protein [Candidatus Tectomicrobia bacterium]